MADKILIFIDTLYIKGFVLKNLYKRGLEFVEVLDDNDLHLKLTIFRDSILFFIIEIKEKSYRKQYELIQRLKCEPGVRKFPILAIIPNDSIEMVSGAKEADIEDVVLIPGKKELFQQLFASRLSEFLKGFPIANNPVRKPELIALSENDELRREMKRANRGKYSISFVMGRLTGIQSDKVKKFYNKLKSEMRDTDRVIQYEQDTFIVICPFTQKENLKEVENKIREGYEKLFGNNTRLKRLDMYGVSYPNDGENIENLFELLEKGVHDSAIISGIREPLNTLSQKRLEEYKKMLRLYK